MNRRICVGGIIVLLVVVAGLIYLQGFNDIIGDDPFDNEGRYEATILDNMGVIYDNQSDIAHWNNGYSENCPWNAIHNGLDYMFYNNSVVIAAAPGIVEEIDLYFLEGTDFYKVGLHIRFNESITIEYGFEGLSSDGANRAQQAAMLDVEVGDWVSKGDQIARFLRNGEYDHVHFSVYANEAICPRLVMGEADYNEIISLVHSFHPTWELCYP